MVDALAMVVRVLDPDAVCTPELTRVSNDAEQLTVFVPSEL
jgi:hypothetical protein